MKIVGIDPGLKGGLAYIEGLEAFACPMPVTGGEIDALAIGDFFQAHEPELVYVEHSQAMPKQGVTSVFNYGKGFGKILGCLETMNIPYSLVRPRAWKAKVLAGTKKDKDAAINFVRCRYPHVDLKPGRCTTPQDGIADAVCIAHYWHVSSATTG